MQTHEQSYTEVTGGPQSLRTEWKSLLDLVLESMWSEAAELFCQRANMKNSKVLLGQLRPLRVDEKSRLIFKHGQTQRVDGQTEQRDRKSRRHARHTACERDESTLRLQTRSACSVKHLRFILRASSTSPASLLSSINHVTLFYILGFISIICFTLWSQSSVDRLFHVM